MGEKVSYDDIILQPNQLHTSITVTMRFYIRADNTYYTHIDIYIYIMIYVITYWYICNHIITIFDYLDNS